MGQCVLKESYSCSPGIPSILTLRQDGGESRKQETSCSSTDVMTVTELHVAFNHGTDALTRDLIIFTSAFIKARRRRLAPGRGRSDNRLAAADSKDGDINSGSLRKSRLFLAQHADYSTVLVSLSGRREAAKDSRRAASLRE